MSRIPLRPVASPVDTFAPAETRRDANSGDALFQLAGALGTFNSGLSRIAEARAYEMQATAETDARSLQMKRQFQSLNELKAAVDRGEISEDDNPWKMVFLKKLVGRNEVRLTAQAIEQEYETSDIRFKDNPAEVEAFVQERFAAMTEGRDNWEISSIAPAAEEFRDDFVAKHIERRAQERDVETRIGFTRQVSQDAVEALSLIQDGADASAVTTRMQQAVNAAGMVVHPEKLRAWASDAVIQAAVASRDPDSLPSLLRSVKIGDKTLADTMPVGAVERVQEEIQNKRVRDLQIEAIAEERANRKEAKEAVNVFDSYLRSERAAGRDPTLDELSLIIDNMQLSPETRAKVRAFAEDANGDRVSDELSRFVGLVEADQVTPADRTSFLRLMLMSGRPGRDAIFTAKQLEAALEVDKWGETDGEAASSIIGIIHGNQSQTEKFAQLEALRTSGRLDMPTYMQAAERVFRSDLQTGEKRAQMVRHAEAVETRLRMAFVEDPRYSAQSDDPFEPRFITEEGQARMGAALHELDDTFWRWVEENPSGSLKDLNEVLKQKAEDIIRNSGGLSEEKFAERMDFGNLERRLTSGSLIAVRGSNEKSITGYKPSPELQAAMGESLIWEEGQLRLKAGDKTKPTNIRLFADARDFATRRDEVAASLNITSDEEKNTFMFKQAMSLGIEAQTEFREKLIQEAMDAPSYKARNEELAKLRAEYAESEKRWNWWIDVVNKAGPGATHYTTWKYGKFKLPTTEELKKWQKVGIEYRRRIRELESGLTASITPKEPTPDAE